jgi:pyridinium-3,5-bisthiocarboxylic acid mononucleotide nickel chelatase
MLCPDESHLKCNILHPASCNLHLAKMKIAYFDCFAGIAGDMALGALLDCGVPIEKLREGLSSLPVEGWSIEAQPVLKGGIHGQSVRIALHGVSDDEELTQHSSTHMSTHHAHEHHHSHEHDHSHEHSHAHEHHHDHSHEHHHEEHHHGRSMRQIRDIINASDLPARVKEQSIAIFWSIAEVEARMHHSTPDEIHFHEIGGVDSLLDICGVAWCLDYLQIEEVYCSALPHSSGTVKCAHGIMPVPAPATLELLKGAPMTPTGLTGEMVTPTGAGIVATLAKGFGAAPAMTIENLGFGAGKKEWPDRPNLLRVVIGQKSGDVSTHENAGLEWRTLSLIETNVDDLNPELWDSVLEALFEAGALDAWLAPIQMKKNRPAQMLGVLCSPDHSEKIVAQILHHTTSLGVRVQTVRRGALPRETREVSTRFGAVRIKTAQWNELARSIPEYDDVKRLAKEHNVAAREVYEAATLAAQEN